MLKITLSTTLKDSSFNEIYNFAKKASFDGLDYDMGLSDFYKNTKLTEEQKKFVVCLHEPRLMFFFESDFFLRKTLKKALELTNTKNPVLNFHLFNFRKPIFLNGLNLIEKINKWGEKNNVIISFESGTTNMASLVNKEGTNPEAFANFCIKNDLNMTMDTSHLGTFDINIIDFFNQYHKRIKLIHLSDYKNGNQHLPLFTGNLPIKKLLKLIKKLNWNGTIAFEIFKFETIDKNEKFKILENNLKEIRKMLK